MTRPRTEALAWPLMPWWLRASLRGIEGYCRAFGWCGFGLRESADVLRNMRETWTAEEYLQAQREDHAPGEENGRGPRT